MPATNLLVAPAPRLWANFCEPSGSIAPGGAVATGKESAAFRLWIDSLPPAGNEALVQLRECGFAYDLAALKVQLGRALQVGPIGPLSRVVGQRVLALLAVHREATCFFLEESERPPG
jgi:hypothetical protein